MAQRVSVSGVVSLAITVITAVGLSCGGDDGGDTGADTELSGVVWYSGPVEGAEIVVWQVFEGERTLEVGRTTTDAEGAWSVNVGLSFESLEIDAIGGAYVEGGGLVELDGSAVLRGVALDVQPAEKRGDVAVTPWTDLVVALGRARLARGDAETTYDAAMARARDLVAAHLDFDPTHTAIAGLGAPAGSPTEPVRYALSLAGAGRLAATVASDSGLTEQDVNTSDLAAVLALDAGSDEALLDGNGDLLTLGPACALPPGCDARGDGCRATCAIYWNTLRSRLALAIAAFLGDGAVNGTGLDREDVQSWLSHLASNDEPELFGGPVEPLDSMGPTITWVAPAGGAVVSGIVDLEVTAADPVGVASLTVEAVGPTPTPVTDTDPAPEAFAGALDTTPLPEGPLTLRATAIDEEGNTATAELVVTADNIDGGTVSGVVFKGPVGGATVEVFRFDGGVKGALLGSGTTASDGGFVNITLDDGYSGPLLIEAGGAGTYTEEAASGTTVTLDVNDRLRSVVADYQDGDALALVAVTPLTSFAVTYYEFVSTQQSGTFADEWEAARSAIEAHFDVPDIVGLAPQRPAEMTTFSSAAKYGLVLAGLSRTAWDASNQGGGDGGSFGPSMNAVRVWKVLDQDLADGCWNGKAGPTALSFGGTQAVTATTARKDLADAIVAYLGSAQNQTPFTGAADVLTLLEALSQSGPASGTGDTCAAGELFPSPGQTYDQTPPVVMFESPTPAPGALVRQTISLRATATDDISAPVASWAAPPGLVDADGVATNAIVTGSIDTTALADGALTVTVQATDASGNVRTASRSFTIDNTQPVLAVATTGFLVDGATWWTTDTGPVLTGTASDAHAVTVTAVIGASTYPANVVGTTWTVDLPAGTVAAGGTDVTIRATDAAGNQATLAQHLRSDTTAPGVNVLATTVSVETMAEVTFVGGVPNHTHSTTSTTLGLSTACDATAPSVSKFAYLLDEAAPMFGTENEKNPLEWAFQVLDDGVGIDPAGTAYRIRQGGTTLVDWRAPGGTSPSHVVEMYRRAGPLSEWPSIPQLGTVDGLFQLDLRARDRFGRETIVTRCWNHHPLAAPFEIGSATAASDGPDGSGKYALAGLLLNSSPADPISAQVLNDNAPGTGLIQVNFSNGVAEDIYVTFEVTPPTSATWSYSGKYAYALTSSVQRSCGTITAPDTSEPCRANNDMPDPVPLAGNNVTSSLPYGVRVWETTGGTHTELLPCTGCENTTLRKQYRIPARTNGVRTFTVTPTVRTIEVLRPGGMSPYSEYSFSYLVNGSSVTNFLTGKPPDHTIQRCVNMQANGAGQLTCTQSETWRRYRALGSISVTFGSSVGLTANAATGPSTPAELRASRSRAPSTWTTAETLPP